jgi:hypothetical protein
MAPKSRARLASPQARHSSIKVHISPQRSSKALLQQSFLALQKSATIRDNPSHVAIIRRQWWGGLVGRRRWPEDSCISFPLAKRKLPWSRDATATAAVSADSNGRRNTSYFTHDNNSSSASAGVFQPNVFLGRALRAAATAAISAALWVLRSVPFGKYWRSSPLVFSLVPRCHGLCGSQK